VESRLELAKSLGATHTVNSRDAGVNLSEKMKSFTNGDGTTITVDTTGNMKAIGDGFEGTASRGQMIFVGVADFNAKLNMTVVSLLGVCNILL
jgi:Zn-dependent alcohol dehydrogenase